MTADAGPAMSWAEWARHDGVALFDDVRANPDADGPYSLLHDEAPEPWVNRLADTCRHTMPGINIPADPDSDAMPIGVQLYGNFAREDLLLLAARIERTRPEQFGATPPVHATKGD